MARNKRAAIRREKREQEKIMKRAESGLTKDLMAKSFLLGKNEGLEMACGIIFLALHEEFGFGNKRIMKLMDKISEESLKMDEEPTKFNVDWYINQLRDKCNIKIERSETGL